MSETGDSQPVLKVVFYASASGNEAVRAWLQDDLMVLLHGFVKKSQKTPAPDLRIARERLADLQKG
jgi:phage-related protein